MSFSKKVKKRLANVALMGVLVAPALGVASLSTVDSAAAAGTFAYTGTITDVMTSNDTTAANTLNNTAFQGVVNTIYSAIVYFVSFFFQSAVISAVIALIVIWSISSVAWHAIKRRSMGAMGWGKRRRR